MSTSRPPTPPTEAERYVATNKYLDLLHTTTSTPSGWSRQCRNLHAVLSIIASTENKAIAPLHELYHTRQGFITVVKLVTKDLIFKHAFHRLIGRSPLLRDPPPERLGLLLAAYLRGLAQRFLGSRVFEDRARYPGAERLIVQFHDLLRDRKSRLKRTWRDMGGEVAPTYFMTWKLGEVDVEKLLREVVLVLRAFVAVGKMYKGAMADEETSESEEG